MPEFALTVLGGQGRLAGAADHAAVLHVGYARTATTTHQRQLFAKHKDIAYLGKPYPNPLMWELVHRFTGADSAMFDQAATRRALETVLSEAVVPGQRVLTLSDEAMLSPFCRDTPVFCARLLALFGDPKVLITIRRQDDLLISFLFHVIRKKYSRPLAVALRELETYGDLSTSLLHFLDYSAVCRSFVEMLGRDNVLIMPYELFKSDRIEYGRRLSGFMGIDADETRRLLDQSVVTNQRQDQASAAYFDFRARYFPNDLKTPRLDNTLVKLFGRFGFNSNHVGKVSARARAICTERFASSNRLMVDVFGLDLQKYHYPGL